MSEHTDTIREALRDSIQAWEIEEHDWAMMRDWFAAQPDEHRHDAKELIAAIDARVTACRQRRESLEVLL